jgi:hypothetical protein
MRPGQPGSPRVRPGPGLRASRAIMGSAGQSGTLGNAEGTQRGTPNPLIYYGRERRERSNIQHQFWRD